MENTKLFFQNKELLELMIYSAENNCTQTLTMLSQIFEEQNKNLVNISDPLNLLFDSCRNYCAYTAHNWLSDNQKKESLINAKKEYEKIESAA